MNDGGTLNLKRFEKFMGALAENEMDRFDDIYSDSKWLEGKTASKQKGKGGKSRHTVKPTPGPAHVEGILMSDSDNMFGTLTQVLFSVNQVHIQIKIGGFNSLLLF